MGGCQGPNLRARPGDNSLTAEYMKEFNTSASEMQHSIRVFRDAGEKGVIDPGDITIDPREAELYGLTKAYLNGKVPSVFSPRIQEFINQIEADVERKKAGKYVSIAEPKTTDEKELERRRLVAKMADRNLIAQYHFEYNLNDIPGPYRKAHEHFEKIYRLTNELIMLQRDPKMPEYEKQAFANAEKGDVVSFELFRRGVGEGCGDFNDDPACFPLSPAPEIDSNGTMWPDDMTDDEFNYIAGSSRPDKEMLMSPFTVVERVGSHEGVPFEKREYRATPYNRHPFFRPAMLEIAAEFEQIASIPGIDKAMSSQASAYADAIRSGDGANPFEKAELLWGTQTGSVMAFIWGPMEEIGKYGVKRYFQFNLDLIRQGMMETMKKNQVILEDLEQLLAGKIEGYVPKTPDLGSVVHIDDALMLGGLGKRTDGVYMASVLPNSGPLMEQMKLRRDIHGNLNDAVFDFVARPIAERGMDPAQLKYVQRPFMTYFAAMHENAHSTGCKYSEIITRDGKEMQIRDAIGAGLFFAFEEAKANAGGMSSYAYLQKRGLMTKEEARAGQTTYIASLIRQTRLGKNSPHGRGAIREMGYLFGKNGNGAIALKEVKLPDGSTDTRLVVDFDKFQDRIENLFADLVRTQMSGDKATAKKFFDDNAAQIPDEWDEFVKRFDGIPMHITFHPHPEE